MNAAGAATFRPRTEARPAGSLGRTTSIRDNAEDHLLSGRVGRLMLTASAPQVMVALIAIGATFGLAVVIATIDRKGFALTDPRLNPRIRRGWIRPARFATGLAALGLAAQQAMEFMS